MARFRSPVDMGRTELRNAVVQVLTAVPSTPPPALIWYRSDLPNSVGNGVIQYQDSSGNTITVGGAGGNASTLNGQAASYYLARANHTGTQLAATISDFDTQVRTSRLDQMAAPTASVSANSQKITNLLDPTSPQDGATKAYVDNLANGVDWKGSVRATSVGANLTLSGTQTVDGVSLIAGDRILVKDQTTASTNGIYVVAAGAWSRSTDADSSAEVTGGMAVFVTEGTANADTGWLLTTNDAIVLNTTALAFTQFTGLGSVLAGAGLTKTGNSLDIGTANATRIVVNADNIDLYAVTSANTGSIISFDNYGRVTGSSELIGSNGFPARTGTGSWAARSITAGTGIQVTNGDGVAGAPTVAVAAAYAGGTSIASLGTVTVGVWNGTAIAVAYGGTGATSAAGAKTNLGFMTRYATDIGNGALTSITVTHNLGTKDVMVFFRQNSDDATVEVDWAATTTNTITVTFAVAPTTNEIRVVVIG